MSDAGVLAYASSGNFNPSSSTGITPNLMYNQKLTQSASVWSYTPKRYWPVGTTTKNSFFAYSPYASGANGLTVSASSVQGTPYVSYAMPSTVANQPDLLIASTTNTVMADGAVNFAFKHALACIGFSIKGNNDLVKSIGIQGISTTGNVSLDGTTIVWSNLGTISTTAANAGINYDASQSYVTATTTQIPASTLMQSSGYLMVIPQTLTTSAQIVVTMNDNSTRTMAISSGSASWTAGYTYTYNINLVELIPAANSFILAPSSTTSLTKYIQAITRVNQFWGSAAQGGFGGSDGDGFVALGNLSTNYIGPSDQWYAQVIWADFAGYTNVTIDQNGTSYGTGSEYLRVNLAAGTYTGNMLIGIKRKGGSQYLWSFHLWITTYDPTLAANQSTMPSGRILMDRNLGATVSGTTFAVSNFGLLYQWGRKDPFLGANSTSSSASRLNPVTGSITISGTFNQGTLLNCVYNPNIFYPCNNPPWDVISTGNLSGANGYNRWGGNSSQTSATAAKGTKTIYDPCPMGWRMPWGSNWMGAAYANFSSATLPANFQWSSVNYGRNYTGSTPNQYFPACGYISQTGIMSGVQSIGNFWGASGYDANNGYHLEVGATYGGAYYFDYRSYGFSVRPQMDN